MKRRSNMIAVLLLCGMFLGGCQSLFPLREEPAVTESSSSDKKGKRPVVQETADIPTPTIPPVGGEDAATEAEAETMPAPTPEVSPTPTPGANTIRCISPANVRTQPTMSGSSVIGALQQGEEVAVTNKVNGWYEILFQGQTGYVYEEFIDGSTYTAGAQPAPDAENPQMTDPNAAAPATQPSQEGAFSSPQTMVCSASVNVRNQPGMSVSSIIGTIQTGESVTVTAEINGWYEVDFQGQKGYVYQDYLTGGAPVDDTTQAADPASEGVIAPQEVE